ncbi:uncharacterized protein LOC117124084 [Anneissia japonica]|uniref:uncharacterized protein LOC117124084 n=1 Tax=Anneissia japonica TaxID=1529436 RepID=UPI0014257020|nr:uncharacterized protein LOC117124084 [Anneissia japonica]
MAIGFYSLIGILCFQGLHYTISQTVDVTPDQRVAKGQRVKITCRITSRNIPYDVRWSLEDQLITNNTKITYKERSSRYIVLNPVRGTWELVIRSARLDDSGDWKCTMMSSKPPISDVMMLSVDGPGGNILNL